MGSYYWRADDKTTSFISEVKEKYHNELHQFDVKIGVIFAMSKEEDGHALKHHGYPAYATIKIITLKDRITKGYDAELMLDAEFWKSSNLTERTALIDHELSHIAVKRKKPAKPKKGQEKTEIDPLGEVQFDDYNRPMLKTVRGDYNVGDGFIKVIQRHQTSAVETHNLNAAMSIVEDALNNPTDPQEYIGRDVDIETINADEIAAEIDRDIINDVFSAAKKET